MNPIALALQVALGLSSAKKEKPLARPQGPGLNIGEADVRRRVGLPTTAKMTVHATSGGTGSGQKAIKEAARRRSNSPQNRALNEGLKKSFASLDRAIDKKPSPKPVRKSRKTDSWNPVANHMNAYMDAFDRTITDRILPAEDAIANFMIGTPKGMFTRPESLTRDDFNKGDIASALTANLLGLGAVKIGSRIAARTAPTASKRLYDPVVKSVPKDPLFVYAETKKIPAKNPFDGSQFVKTKKTRKSPKRK